jgi:DNA-binding PadR family transcriptional regulator
MSAIDLFLLGFIKEKSQSAYDMARFVENHQIQRMVKISTPAIYKNLLKLAKKGYLATEKVKEGEMPEKTIYSITEEGEKFWRKLMEKFSCEPVKFHFDFNSVIINLDKMEKEEAYHYLNNLKEEFYSRKALLEKNMVLLQHIPFEGRQIMKQFHMLNETLIQWLENFMIEYLR